jgi:hypothetical protein
LYTAINTNELADNLAKEATKSKETIYKKNTEKSNSTTGDTTKYRKVANPMGTNNKRINNKTIPSKHKGKTKEKNSANTQPNSNSDSPRGNKRLPTKI